MYIETLSGHHTTLDKLIQDIFILKFTQNLTNSNHSSIIVSSKYCPSLKAINLMLGERNRYYSANHHKIKQTFNNYNGNESRLVDNRGTERKGSIRSTLDSD